MVQFSPWFKCYFLLFLGIVMNDNEFETKLSHNITVIVFPLISAFPSSSTPLVKSAKIVPHYTPLKFVNRKTTPTKPCSLVPMALKEICPGNEVYAIIILGVGVGVGVRGGGAANRNCHGRNRCRQSLEHERKKRKSNCENTKPKCARNFVQWRD